MIDMKLAGYHIVSNRHEVMVSKINKMKTYVVTGDDVRPQTETTVGHYNNLKQALSGIRQNILRTGDTKITTIDEYRSESNRIDKMFDDFMDQQLPKSKYEN